MPSTKASNNICQSKLKVRDVVIKNKLITMKPVGNND